VAEKQDYLDTKGYGTWRVSTEGDCEGKSVRDLGVHTGYLADIAFALSGEAMYGLAFSLYSEDAERDRAPPQRNTVHIRLEIDSATWDMTPEDRVRFMESVLTRDDPGIVVTESNYYASVTLVREDPAKKIIDGIKAKLSKGEIEFLGLDKPRR